MPAHKDELRAASAAVRSRLKGTARKRELDEAIGRHARDLVETVGRSLGHSPTVAAYHPLPSEPGGVTLLASISNANVLLPRSLPGGVLEWAWSNHDLVPGALGISCLLYTSPSPRDS